MSLDPLRVTAHTMSHLPRLLAQRRERVGLSMAAAALEIGIGKATVNDVEKRKLDPSLSVALKIVEWLAPPPGQLALLPELTPAARSFVETLHERQGLGQAWLRIENGTRGLVVPDVEGSLGELAHVSSYAMSTVGEIEAAGLLDYGVIDTMPAHRGPRNRNRRNIGWPIDLRDPQASPQIVDEGSLLG